MSRTPANIPLAVVRGATWEDEFTYQDEDGVAIDLTGYSARMQVRTVDLAYGLDPDDDGLIAEYTTAAGQITITELTGKVALRVEAEDTVALNPDNEKRVVHSYGIELYMPAINPEPEYVVPLCVGKLRVHGEIVR